MLKYIFFTVIFFIATSAIAQDKVHIGGYKDVKGKILEYHRDSLIVYIDKKGVTRKIYPPKMKKVKDVVIKGNYMPERNWYISANAGLSFSSYVANPDLRLQGAWRINQFFYPGVGVGIDYYDEYDLIPVYANIYGFSNGTANATYYNLKIGPTFAAEKSDFEWGENEEVNAGLSWEAGFGKRFYTQDLFIEVGLAYKQQIATREWFNEWSQTSSQFKTTFRRVSVRVGFGF